MYDSVSVLSKTCRGIIAWKYYPRDSWYSVGNAVRLWSVTYNKQKRDTFLRVAFHSTLGEHSAFGCSQWYITFNGQTCKSPAPISSLVFTAERKNTSWTIAPAEISGFCSETRAGHITAGSLTISAHVASCTQAGRMLPSNAHTGTPKSYLKSTSAMVVEEYC